MDMWLYMGNSEATWVKRWAGHEYQTSYRVESGGSTLSGG